MEDVRRRLQGADDNEKDGSDSNCSDNVSGGAFRPTGAGSPKEGSKNNTSGSSYPSPNISVGPPIQPPPHLLPYLYPHGIYNHVAPPLSLLHNPAMNPGLFLNAQLALAAQHPALFGHYSGHSPSSPLHNLKAHRFSPYSLPGLHHQGSAFDAVTPGQSNSNVVPPERSVSSSPPLSHSLNPNSNSPASNRPQSVSPTPNTRPLSQQSSSAFTPQVPSNNNNERSSNKNGNGSAITNNNNSTIEKNSTTASELKNMEKMVNGLEMQHQNGTVPTSLASSGSIRSLSPDDQKKIINLDQ
jgi:T-box protein 2